MNPEFLINALNKTLQEFFVTFEKKVVNTQFQVCYAFFTQTTLSKEMKDEMIVPFKNREFCKKIQDLIQKKDTNLFDIENNEIMLFEKIAIKEWYTKLTKEDQELAWKYLKSLFQICSMLAK